jgi:hypothetical protein
MVARRWNLRLERVALLRRGTWLAFIALASQVLAMIGSMPAPALGSTLRLDTPICGMAIEDGANTARHGKPAGHVPPGCPICQAHHLAISMAVPEPPQIPCPACLAVGRVDARPAGRHVQQERSSAQARAPPSI